jgi:hypothetical protein
MPNYSILQNVLQQQPQQQNQYHPIIKEILEAQNMVRQRQKEGQESAILKAQQELYGTQNEREKFNLAKAPELHEMEKQKHQAYLDQNKTNMAATQANIAATKQGMTTEALRQQQLRDERNLKHMELSGHLLDSVATASPEQRAQKYKSALNVAKKYGLDTSQFPAEYNDDAANLVNHFHEKRQAELNAQAATQPLEKVMDPVTKQPVFVSRQDAIGKQVYDPKLMAAQNPIAAELPKAQAKQLVSMQNESAETAQKASDLKNDVLAFQGATNQMTLETGAKWRAPGSTYLSGEAQNAQQITKKLVLSASSSLKGAISDRDMVNIEASMPSITNTPDANKKISQRIIAATNRAEQKPLFEQAMMEQGIYDPGKIKAAWTKYINENPLFDPKTGEVIEKNIAGWEKYVNPNMTNSKEEKKTAMNDPLGIR